MANARQRHAELEQHLHEAYQRHLNVSQSYDATVAMATMMRNSEQTAYDHFIRAENSVQALRTEATGYRTQAESLVTDLRGQLAQAQARANEQKTSEAAAGEALKAQCREEIIAVEKRAVTHVTSLKQ